ADDRLAAEDAALRQRGTGRARDRPRRGPRARRSRLLALVVAADHAGGQGAAGAVLQAPQVLTDARRRSRAMRGVPPLLEAMRPRQWSKNVFVLAGIVFAGRLFEARAELRVLACFALFCAASSAVYLANDVADRGTDVHHPLKRQRPVASGRLRPATAIAASTVLTAAALVAAALLNRATLGMTAGYL